MEEVVGVYVVHGIREDAHGLPSVVGGGIAKPVHEVLVAAKFVRREARDEAAVSDAVDDVLAVRQRTVAFGGNERVRHQAGDVESIVEAAGR